MGGFAWVTLATNDSYSLGALVLAHSLKAVGSAHQLAVLVTPGVTSAMRDKLAAVFNLVQEVNILDSRDETNLRLLKRPELGITFTKLHCWRLTQYEKCVFLDADTLVLQYCDELFEREELSAAPDVGWPDCFNSGVFVYRPSLETYEKLIQFALEKGSFDGGDQGLLNLYFSDWAHKDISRHLPFIYNMCSTACYSYLPAYKQFGANAKIMHFIGPQKPWLQYFNTETRKVQPSGDSSHLQEVLQRWWDIFCSLIHPHLSPAMAGLAGAFAQLTLGVPRTIEQDALENVLRKQAWEVGNIDYLGRDSFDNIWSKITETLSIAPPAASPTSAPESKQSAPEPEPSAPAQSQSESAPPQEEAKSVPPLATPATDVTSTDNLILVSTKPTPPIEAPKDQEQIAQVSADISSTPASKELVVQSESKIDQKEPVSGEAAEVVSSDEVKKVEGSQSQPLTEVAATPKEKETQKTESKIQEPQTDIPKPEAKAPEPKADVPVAKTEASEPQAELPKTEAKAPEPQSEKPVDKEPASEVAACPIPQKKVSEPKIADTQPPTKVETVVEPVCPLPHKKEVPKETEPLAQVTTSQPKQKEIDTPAISKESEAVLVPSPEPAILPQQPETSPEKPKVSAPSSEGSAPPTEPSSKTATEPSPKEVSTAPKPTASAIPSPAAKGTSKTAASKDSPKTKVTEATPPATPSSPLAEKSKQALTAEENIPDTPPPTEGGSTPTPPPRKTDKPKKVAAKPKK